MDASDKNGISAVEIMSTWKPKQISTEVEAMSVMYRGEGFDGWMDLLIDWLSHIKCSESDRAAVTMHEMDLLVLNETWTPGEEENLEKMNERSGKSG